MIAPCDGFFKLEAIPGSRLPFGEVIGGISSGESLPESWDQGLIKSKLQVEAEKLYDHQYQLRLQLELLNAKNDTLESLLRSAPTQSTLAQKTHKELIALKKEKERILRNIQQYQLSISNLQARFDLVQGPKAVLTAIVPGYFFNQFDNQEGRLTPGAYKSLTPNDLRRNYPLQSGAVKVKAGAVIGKIVSPFQQRIAIEVDPELIREHQAGDLWWLKLNDNLIQVSFVATIQPDNGRKILYFDDPLFAAGIQPQRRSRVYLVYRRVSGVTVPLGALHHKGQAVEVKVMKGDGFERKQVRVIESDSYQAVIEGIEFGTTIFTR